MVFSCILNNFRDALISEFSKFSPEAGFKHINKVFSPKSTDFVPIVYIFGKFIKIVYNKRKIASREKCRGKGGTQISDLGWGEIKGGNPDFPKIQGGNLPLYTL